jgi:hypothetical protein
MDHAFNDFIGKFMDDYQDDIIVHSKLRECHLKHLKKFFQRFRKYDIALNPKK